MTNEEKIFILNGETVSSLTEKVDNLYKEYSQTLNNIKRIHDEGLGNPAPSLAELSEYEKLNQLAAQVEIARVFDEKVLAHGKVRRGDITDMLLDQTPDATKWIASIVNELLVTNQVTW